MSKIIKFSLGSLAGLALTLSVLAQDASSTPSVTPTETPIRTPIRQEIKNNIQQMHQENQQIMENAKQQMEAKREELKQNLEQQREQMKQRMEQEREMLKNKIETKKEELKTHLATIRDEHKKQAVERINDNLDSINARVTTGFSNALDMLGNVLDRIVKRSDDSEVSGIDVSSVVAAVVAAQTAIGDARTAVEAQAGKTYPITISTENKLKTDVGKARQALYTDLKTVRDKIRAARDAAYQAARALAKANGHDLPSPSPEISPSPSVSESPTITPTISPTP